MWWLQHRLARWKLITEVDYDWIELPVVCPTDGWSISKCPSYSRWGLHWFGLLDQRSHNHGQKGWHFYWTKHNLPSWLESQLIGLRTGDWWWQTQDRPLLRESVPRLLANNNSILRQGNES
jgi:hypothetical protein